MSGVLARDELLAPGQHLLARGPEVRCDLVARADRLNHELPAGDSDRDGEA
jgi:hypothetical protein